MESFEYVSISLQVLEELVSVPDLETAGLLHNSGFVCFDGVVFTLLVIVLAVTLVVLEHLLLHFFDDERLLSLSRLHLVRHRRHHALALCHLTL